MKTLIQFFNRYSLATILLLIAMVFAQQIFSQSQSQTFSTPGTFSGVNGFTAPAGITSITVEVWGGGGAGGGGNIVAAAGGGGGGYTKNTAVTVVPGTQYTIVVGAGGIGAATAGQAGGLSSGTFGTTIVTAGGGGGGAGANNPVGAGGTGGNTGGSGAPGVNLSNGGGGGSSAGPGTGAGTNGINAISGTGAAAVTGGGAGGNGGTPGSPGLAPGGGGGGGINFGSVSGGSGGNGKVVISWCITPALTVTTPVTYCQNAAAVPLTATGSNLLWYTVSSGGTGSSNAPTPGTTTAGTTAYYVSQTVGCEGPRTQINVVVNAMPVSSVTGQTNITCFAANDGTITVSASGGASPYTFSIDNGTSFLAPTGTNLRLFTGLLPNTAYRIKVKDSNGCISK